MDTCMLILIFRIEALFWHRTTVVIPPLEVRYHGVWYISTRRTTISTLNTAIFDCVVSIRSMSIDSIGPVLVL